MFAYDAPDVAQEYLSKVLTNDKQTEKKLEELKTEEASEVQES